MTQTITASEAHTKVEGAAEVRPEVRDFTGAEVGQVARQGDIYIARVAGDHRFGKPCGTKLAMGNTQGSRHVAEGDVRCFEGTHAPSWCEAGTFLGPFISVGAGGGVVTHPEHAHIALGEGCYQVTHQMDAATRDRVVD